MILSLISFSNQNVLIAKRFPLGFNSRLSFYCFWIIIIFFFRFVYLILNKQHNAEMDYGPKPFSLDVSVPECIESRSVKEGPANSTTSISPRNTKMEPPQGVTQFFFFFFKDMMDVKESRKMPNTLSVRPCGVILHRERTWCDKDRVTQSDVWCHQAPFFFLNIEFSHIAQN